MNTTLRAITMTNGGHQRGRAAMSRKVGWGSQRTPVRRLNSPIFSSWGDDAELMGCILHQMFQTGGHASRGAGVKVLVMRAAEADQGGVIRLPCSSCLFSSADF